MTTFTSRLLPGVPLIESPFFEEDATSVLDVSQLTVARQLREKGYAIIDFHDYDPDIESKIDGLMSSLHDQYDWDAWRKGQVTGLRIQDAWRFDERVKDIATNNKLLDLLSALYQREPIPFQTLNFPVGTEQAAHSDHAHFSSVPERFMCGVWLAFENIDDDNGPLFYYPGSHRWPSYQNEHLGVGAKDITEGYPGYGRYVRLWNALAEKQKLPRECFRARKGQALIWSSNIVHGGSPQVDKSRTRWSQVTHYFFENCVYTTPVANDTYQGKIEFRQVTNIKTGELIGNKISGSDIRDEMLEVASSSDFSFGYSKPTKDELQQALSSAAESPFASDPGLPPAFNVSDYLRLNPDVLAAGVDPFEHFLVYGLKEGRQF